MLQVEEFAMGRQAVTQGQWRAVANLPRMECDLDPNPGKYSAKGLWGGHVQPGGLPVHAVSWNDCREWLRRLNRWLLGHWPRLGGQGEPPQLALPSEGQWEVTCRAGANSAFHFGDTLDSNWANFDARFTYGVGRLGLSRYRPLPVGSFGLVNHWGLCEMHGQVWEWCGDRWHPDPINKSWPSDGHPWQEFDPSLEGPETSQKDLRLLRGGFSSNPPESCRSAFRVKNLPDFRHPGIGFRVCCLPQHPSTSEPEDVNPLGAQEGSRPAPVISQRFGTD
jgi:formylglycine-generating enzyme required for sulfatase activity